MDILIIGAGLSGATVANKFAKAGKKVIVLEKRSEIAGNVYDTKMDGVLTHAYGPHIFHTDLEEVNSFMNEFWELNDYRNIVEGEVLDQIVPLPFNFTGIDKFWPNETEDIKATLIAEYGKDARVSINELLKNDNETVKEIAEFVFKNIFENYTTKMWGIAPKDIDKSVLDRVPVIIGYKNTYFNNKFEGLPKEGYTTAVAKMLDHKNIEVRLNNDALDLIEFKDTKIFFEDLEVTCPIIYSGQIDELFNYSEGHLSYRSLSIEFESLNETHFQSTAVLNKPADPTMTRIVEYKNMTKQEIQGKTVISREYPGAYKLGNSKFGTPYYPMANDESRLQYDKYVKLASIYTSLHMVGRLATFKYLDMDKTIEAALAKAKELLG